MTRRRRGRRKRVNHSLVLVQIAMLVLALVLIMMFRGSAGKAADTFLGAFGDGEDIEVTDERGAARRNAPSGAVGTDGEKTPPQRDP